MSKKSFILSSSGLKNIIQNQDHNQDEEFIIIFGQHEIKTKTFFAEFISPYISQIHQTDPTINSIEFPIKNIKYNKMNKDYFQEETIQFIKQLIEGKTIEINQTQCKEIQKISILLENEEMYSKLEKLFPTSENEEAKINETLDFLIFYENYSNNTDKMNINDKIEFISEHFYSIEENKIYELPTGIFYLIIKNDKLTIENEDKLIEIINNFFNYKESKEKYNCDEISRTYFYEEIDFEFLSESKFKEFIENFNINEMTNQLFSKIKKCFYYYKHSDKTENDHHHYKQQGHLIEYDNNEEHAFNGIIQELTNKFGCNVDDKDVVKVTSSSTNGSNLAKYSVDLDDKSHYFQSYSRENLWLQFDFKERKVHPTHYSIRTRHDYGKGSWHPKNWDIEGSNDNEKWTTLDSRRDITCLDDSNLIHTFKIQNSTQIDKFFRFLRIRSTGPDTHGAHHLTISALEYFGAIIDID